MQCISPMTSRIEGAAGRRKGPWPLAGLCLLIIVSLVVGPTVDLQQHMETGQAWAAALGAWAPGAYIFVCVVATLMGVPGTPLTLLAVFLFGSALGFVVMVVASSASAILAFLIARHVGRDVLMQRLGGTEPFRRLSELIKEHQWIAIPFVQVVPLFPFAVVNYGLGLTGIALWRYVFWSELIIIPGEAVLAFGANALYEALLQGWPPWAVLPLATAAVLFVLGIALLGKRAFARPCPPSRHAQWRRLTARGGPSTAP